MEVVKVEVKVVEGGSGGGGEGGEGGVGGGWGGGGGGVGGGGGSWRQGRERERGHLFLVAAQIKKYDDSYSKAS
jgi:hypothetical protein